MASFEIQLYHPGEQGVLDEVLLTEEVEVDRFDATMILRSSPGVRGYMRPIYARIRMVDTEGAEQLGSVLLTIAFKKRAADA